MAASKSYLGKAKRGVSAFSLEKPCFGRNLNPSIRWVRLAGSMPWEHIEDVYLHTMSTETGSQCISLQDCFWHNLHQKIQELHRRGMCGRNPGEPLYAVLPGASGDPPGLRPTEEDIRQPYAHLQGSDRQPGATPCLSH